MKLFCMWCAALLVAGASGQLAQEDGFYAPQTFKNHVGRSQGLFRPALSSWNGEDAQQNKIETYRQGLFKPAAQPWSRSDAQPQQNRLAPEPWRPAAAPVEPWRPTVGVAEPWKQTNSKEQSAAILHHKQALTADGNFRYEFASDNGVAAGEVIEPDGTRVGAFQYKDPSGQLVKLKYRAGKGGFQVRAGETSVAMRGRYTLVPDGNFRYEFASDNGVAAGEVIEPDGTRVGAFQYKDPSGQLVKLKYRAGKGGFQIIEGSHLPKSPEPVAYPQQGAAYQQAYGQQRQQFDLQQQHDQQPQQPRMWTQATGPQQFQNYPAAAAVRPQAGAGNQYYQQSNWAAGRQEQEDDGQYRENDIDDERQGQALNQGPHNFGEGYSFEFQG